MDSSHISLDLFSVFLSPRGGRGAQVYGSGILSATFLRNLAGVWFQATQGPKQQPTKNISLLLDILLTVKHPHTNSCVRVYCIQLGEA